MADPRTYHEIEARLTAFAEEMAEVVRERLAGEPERMQVLGDAVTELEEIVDAANHPDDVGRARLAIKFIASIWLTVDEINARYFAETPVVDKWLTSRDPEPPPGTLVEMEDGKRWHRGYAETDDGQSNWAPEPYVPEHETWTKVAGNYGPVKVIKWGEEDDDRG